MLDLPWSVRTEDATDVAAARAVLDADHHGLDDVKDRIVEYLAVRARRAERGLEVVGGRGSGAVVLLAGPPGVGKTSLGESVARALGRKFVRVALGGVRDEAEIRGHRRTYVGALPGRIVRAVKEAGSMNPVVLLDEVDKVGSDYRGDPAAALLEVLDPAQNHTFRDHYLELDLDLSDVLFIATANVLDTIPPALLDRMELVSIDGYTEDDKVAIARDFLVPRQRERAALAADEVDGDRRRRCAELAADYTREAGVRQLERLIAKAFRKVATRLASGDHGAGPGGRGGAARPRRPAAVHPGGARAHRRARCRHRAGGDRDGRRRALHRGVGAAGRVLAARPHRPARRRDEGVGADRADLRARARRRARRRRLGARTRPLHLHVPGGRRTQGRAVGRRHDDDRAGVAGDRAADPRRRSAMTGEVSLTGRVLPIGGVKQKLLAAQRAGLTEVFLPARNEPDLDDVPAEVKEALTVHLVSDVRQILETALEPATASPASTTAA